MEDANAKEWKTDAVKIDNPEVKTSVIKIDTIKNVNPFLAVTVEHSKSDWALSDGRKFSITSADTVPLSQYKSFVKVDSKPVYSNVVLSSSLKWKFIFLVWVMIIFVTMAYGPIAAFLVELFPTKIRYTSMSLPYHIGNGVFGGLVPFIATLLATTFTTDPLVGLWYPIGVAALCFVIGALYLTNKIDKNVDD